VEQVGDEPTTSWSDDTAITTPSHTNHWPQRQNSEDPYTLKKVSKYF